MIYLDDRVGSKELLKLFPPGLATLTHLEYADAMFMGHSKSGDVAVGVERKRISDLVSSMVSGRLSGHQLIGMLNSYHYLYLVVEDAFRANPRDGVLEVWRRGGWVPYHTGKRQYMARDIWTYMNTLEIVCGVHCYYCPRETDTAQYIMALHHWWQKEYDEHRSHMQPQQNATVQLTKHSLVRRMASQLDGIGWEKAKVLSERFDSMIGLIMASEEELMGIEGIGKVLADRIIEQLRGV